MSKFKSFGYNPSESDVKTMLATLFVMEEALPDLELEETNPLFKQECLKYGKSAEKSLTNLEEKISFNELQAIYNSLVIADMINRKELTVDAQLTQFCLDNIFGINKLLPVFENFFDI